MTSQQLTNEQKLLFNKHQEISKLQFIIFMFQVVLALSVFDTKILNNYGDHHFITLFSVTSSVYVVISVILLFIGYSIEYKIYLIQAQTANKLLKGNSNSHRVLEHKKLTTECKFFFFYLI